MVQPNLTGLIDPAHRLPDDHEVMLSKRALAGHVRRLAGEITRDVAALDPVLIGVLKGSMIFMADLIRLLDFPLSIDFLAVSSYQGTTSTGVVRILKDLDHPISGRHVVLIEVSYLAKYLRDQHPASLRICSLLDKISARTAEVDIDYVGHQFTRGYVVGYGMDYHQRYRNLPHLAVLYKPDL
jgi:hypoxanthine phosphoribosyltransferase